MIGLATFVAVYRLVSLPCCNQNMAIENPSFIDDFPIQPLFSSGIFQLAIFESPSEDITCPAVFPTSHFRKNHQASQSVQRSFGGCNGEPHTAGKNLAAPKAEKN